MSPGHPVIIATGTATTDINCVTTDAIAERINEEHQLAHERKDAAVQHAIRAGELLIEQKERLPHGEFGIWIKANCSAISERTARAYMRVAKLAGQNGSTLPFSSLRSALEPPRAALPSAPARLSRRDRMALQVHGELREHFRELKGAENAVKKAQRALSHAQTKARAALKAFREQQPTFGSEHK